MSRSLVTVPAFLVLTAAVGEADTLTIEHRAVECAVAEAFPRLEARLTPPDAVAKARVVFQRPNSEHWYAVTMRAEGPAFAAVLPRPRKDLDAFQYYIEVTDKAMGTVRTANYTTSIVATDVGCRGKTLAASLGSASVLLEAPEGAAAVPAGFSSAGVVAAASAAAVAAGATAAGGAGAAAAGGGLGTGAIVAGAGALAAGAAVAVATRGDSGSATTYSGPFNGEIVIQRVYRTPGFPGQSCAWTHVLSGTMTITLEDSGGAVTGNAELMGTETETSEMPGCGPLGSLPFSWGSPVSGPPGALTFTAERRMPNNPILSLSFTGALSGGVITGTVTYGQSGQIDLGGGSNSTFSGSTTFPVTLR